MRVAFCVLLSAVLCGFAAAQAADDTGSPYVKAAQALAKGDKLAALSLLSATLKQQPNFLPVRMRTSLWLRDCAHRRVFDACDLAPSRS